MEIKMMMITNQGKSEQMLQALLEQVKRSHYIYAYNTDTITTYNAECLNISSSTILKHIP
jgi:hypothetical protein